MCNLEEALKQNLVVTITLCFISLIIQGSQLLKPLSQGLSNVFTAAVINASAKGHLVPEFETLFLINNTILYPRMCFNYGASIVSFWEAWFLRPSLISRGYQGRTWCDIKTSAI